MDNVLDHLSTLRPPGLTSHGTVRPLAILKHALSSSRLSENKKLVLCVGRTGSGKTSLLGLLASVPAEYVPRGRAGANSDTQSFVSYPTTLRDVRIVDTPGLDSSGFSGVASLPPGDKNSIGESNMLLFTAMVQIIARTRAVVGFLYCYEHGGDMLQSCPTYFFIKAILSACGSGSPNEHSHRCTCVVTHVSEGEESGEFAGIMAGCSSSILWEQGFNDEGVQTEVLDAVRSMAKRPPLAVSNWQGINSLQTLEPCLPKNKLKRRVWAEWAPPNLAMGP